MPDNAPRNRPAETSSLRLPSLFSDNTVLQQNAPISVWGEGRPRETILVSINQNRATARVDAKGRWKLKLPPMPAGGPYEMAISDSKQEIKLRNICVGEVWIASGQSNMEWVVGRSIFLPGVDNFVEEIAAANYPMIRQFNVAKRVSSKPQTEAPGNWRVCSSETVSTFSAVAFFFARDLHKKLGVPIGIINCAWSGMPAETFVTLPTLKAGPEFKAILKRHADACRAYPAQAAKFQKDFKDWLSRAQKTEAEGGIAPNPPAVPGDPLSNPARPAGLYNAMILPITPYTIKGVIWYQGESNASRAWQYRKLFPALIRDWRAAWGQGDLPFLFVQLCNYAGPADGTTWAELREAQALALSLPNTGMAVAVDVGDSFNLHPSNKQDVGSRLALSARSVAYGETLDHSGPVFDSMKVQGNKIRIKFKQIGQGLVAQNGKGKANLNGALHSFTIAGKNKKLVPAQAKIEGNTVVVWSDEVKDPLAVRYAWINDPASCNLYNQAGLPAAPFRTDNWTISTKGAE